MRGDKPEEKHNEREPLEGTLHEAELTRRGPKASKTGTPSSG